MFLMVLHPIFVIFRATNTIDALGQEMFIYPVSVHGMWS
jgi:hypothetical protein